MIELLALRILLRDHRMEDLPSHHKLLSDPVTMRYLPDIKTTTLAESEMNLQNAMRDVGKPERAFAFLRMEHRGRGEFIGEIGNALRERTPLGRHVGIGYFTFHLFWGMDMFQRRSGSTPVILKENAASERVVQKIGMIREADFIQYQLHESQMKDRAEYRLLRDRLSENSKT